MSIKRTTTILGTGLASLGLILGLSPQAWAADNWDPGYIKYKHGRYTYNVSDGHSAYATITWDDYYRVSITGSAKDTKADGRYPGVYVSYWWHDQGAWHWAEKKFISATGGKGTVKSNAQHSTVDVKWLQVQFCDVGKYDRLCSDWKVQDTANR
ncbi:hypothetical protein [Streptomyces sp. NPDC055099]